VGALLMSQWIDKEFGHHETLNEELIGRGAKALSESSPGSRQQAALYSDEWSADFDPGFAREDAGMLLDMVVQAQ
jgi:hypothetical protein